ncbi:MAG: DNA polymerase IV [Verrucomicrobiota bacterium]
MPEIIHLDADAFFASVEQSADARLRGKAIAVGGESRGIIASASYEARKLGIFTPMPTARARKLCPNLIVIPGDYERYEEYSWKMFSFAYDFTPNVEKTSIDEGYFDVTANRSKSADEIAQIISKAIWQKLKITVSEGVGSNKLVSQIASKLNKPAAFESVPAGCEKKFLHPLPNRWLPGVGPKASARLNAAGLARIGQIAATPIDMLALLLGNQAPAMRQFSNGIDDRPLIPASEPQKSYSKQETFNEDVTDEEYVEAVLRRMADKLFSDVREEGRSVRTLTVKIRYNDWDESQRAESLREPTDLETDVYGRIRALLREAWQRRVSLRLVSLKLSNVYQGVFRSELPLEANAQNHAARERLAAAVDGLRRIKGWRVVSRGHDLRLRSAPRDLVNEQKAPARIHITAKRTNVPTPSLAYVPLRVRSHYTFLDSTLSPTAIAHLAKRNGMSSVAMMDVGNLHGAVEFSEAAKRAGIKPVFGAELRVGEHPLLLYVESARGYENLNRILSQKAEQSDDEEAVAEQQRRPIPLKQLSQTEGLIAVSSDVRLAERFPDRFYELATKQTKAGDYPIVACPAVHYALPGDRLKFDIVQSIRTRTLLRQSHPAKRSDGKLHFRTQSEMAGACKEHPEWLKHSLEIAERCSFDVPFGKPQFPAYVPVDGSTPREFLRRLVMEGLRRRYGNRASSMHPQVEQELAIIIAVGYEEYFLVVWSILQDCRTQGISWITRGSAADSLVCYCLGISGVCPIRFGLYFRRFLNQERMELNKLPDIDVDFPHDRKDDVVDIVFAKYGREHCAVVGGFSTFQAKSAFADVAKVLGVAERDVRKFTNHFPWSFGGGWVPDEHTPSGGAKLRELLAASPENCDLPLNDEPYKTALDMAEFLDGVPRNPKMHPCGVVLSRQPMMGLTPTFISNKGYATTHFDMDAVELVGLVKVDVLAQGGLAVMRDVKTMLSSRGVSVDLDALEPWQDAEVWEYVSRGARAVHHIESPAMTSLCRQTNVRDIDTLIAIVSVIRPGAANEGKKLSFTRRYQGLEPITYPHPSLEPVLKDAFGLVVYEEHILQICEAFAGLNPGRADVLRRALNKQRRKTIEEIRLEFFASAKERGHTDEKIIEVWELVAGFAGYAFCKAHSTAYGVEAYQSAWLKLHYPAQFMAAVLTNGKGFYDPLVYVLESYRLGLKFLPPSVNEPGPEFTVHGDAIRVPLIRVKGLGERTTKRLLSEFELGKFASLPDFHRRVKPAAEEMEIILRAGGCDEFGQSRTRQFWEAQRLAKAQAHNPKHRDNLEFDFEAGTNPVADFLNEHPSLLREPTRRERLETETELFGYSVSGHPLELYADIAWETYCPVAELHNHVGETIVACGLVVEQRTHHQITGEPMKFLTLADWTGMVETELFAKTYKNYALATVRYPVLEVEAKVEAFENGRGYTLRVLRAGKPRAKQHGNRTTLAA